MKQKTRFILSITTGFILVASLSFASSKKLLLNGVNHQVIISNFEFKPSKLNVKVGDTVTWINNDIVPHNIAINMKQKALSPEIGSDQVFVYKVDKSLTYICGLHPSMKGKLIVK